MSQLPRRVGEAKGNGEESQAVLCVSSAEGPEADTFFEGDVGDGNLQQRMVRVQPW